MGLSRRGALGGIALGLAAGWNVSNVGAVARELARAYDVGLVTIGLFTTSLFLVHAAMQIPAGRLIDRFGGRRVGLVGLAVIAVSSLVTLAWQDPYFAIAVRGMTGIGTGLCFVAGSDYVRAGGGTPFAQGLFGGFGVGGGGLALAIVPQAERLAGWRAPFVTALAIALISSVALGLAPADAARGERSRRGGLLADRGLYRFAIVHAASFGLSVVLGNWVVTLLERHGGYSSQKAGAVGALTLALAIVSRPVGGWVVERRRALVASFAACSLGTVALTAAHPLALVLVAATAIGFAAGIPFSYAFTGAARARPDAPAAAVGFVNMLAAATILVGTPLLGFAFSRHADRIGVLVVAALFAAALAALPSRRA
jgi:MFS family permease